MVWDKFAKNVFHQFRQEKMLVGHSTEVFIPIDGQDVSISLLSGDFARVEGLLIKGSDPWGRFSSKILDEKHVMTSWGVTSSSTTVPHANYVWFGRKRKKGVSSLGNADFYLRRMLALFLMSEWRVPFFDTGRPLLYSAGISHIFRKVTGRLFLSSNKVMDVSGVAYRCRLLSAGIGIWPCLLLTGVFDIFIRALLSLCFLYRSTVRQSKWRRREVILQGI